MSTLISLGQYAVSGIIIEYQEEGEKGKVWCRIDDACFVVDFCLEDWAPLVVNDKGDLAFNKDQGGNPRRYPAVGDRVLVYLLIKKESRDGEVSLWCYQEEFDDMKLWAGELEGVEKLCRT